LLVRTKSIRTYRDAPSRIWPTTYLNYNQDSCAGSGSYRSRGNGRTWHLVG